MMEDRLVSFRRNHGTYWERAKGRADLRRQERRVKSWALISRNILRCDAMEELRCVLSLDRDQSAIGKLSCA